MKNCLIILLMVCVSTVSAQIGYWPNDTEGKDRSLYALHNITLHTDAKTVIENGVLIFQEGKIINSGKIAIPKNAVVLDGRKAHVYPSFIDPYAQIGVQDVERIKGERSSIYLPEDATSSAYNDAMNARVRAVETYVNDSKSSDSYLQQGFGTVLTFQQDGIVRGTSVLVGLGEGNTVDRIIKPDAAFMLSFDKGSSQQAYPSSLMGSIAMLRQIYLDADWYEKGGKNEYKNPSLEAFSKYKTLPTIIETKDKWDVLRADQLGDEAGQQFIFMGSGNEYQRAQEIKNTNGIVILPLEYPKAFQIEDALDVHKLDISDLKHWELAPYNAKLLYDKKVPFVLTMNQLKDKSSFLSKLRKLKETGLSSEEILTSLTERTASMLNVANEIGQLKKGYLANFIITSDDIFEEKSILYENWVQGQQNIINKIPETDIRGNYTFILGNETYDIEIGGKITQPEATIKQGEDKGKIKIIVANHKVAMDIHLPNDSTQNYRVFYPIKEFKNSYGKAVDKFGHEVPYRMEYVSKYVSSSKKEEANENTFIGKVWYPFNAFGSENLPEQENYIITNATVWTNTKQGIVENTDVLVSNGKIQKIGTNIPNGNAKVIDGTGMHLTSGVIDEHTHIGISRGVNESGTNNSSEVRIADVINPDDINFYRQLAGGVTVAQQLHGSANPIGGQSSIVKFRWGDNAEGMKFKNAPKFIKFALGENVKQSNWGNSANRFPHSRPGVEQTMDFWFTRALEYEKAKKANQNFRKDLRLDATLEVVKNERLITCHSYVQSEINMFMNIAEKFGFRINTFTHILEGYKVAERMKEHGVNASTFSDWWAYKEEVREAIPYNASLLNNVGVTTAINSDDAEMARRLNQEAGKMVKYGNTSQEEAWKSVTLNPAKMMHIDERVGSIEVGKDADLVLWSDNPLSIYAKATKTFVDGILYYDIDEQEKKDQKVAEEKNRIIQKMLFSEDVVNGNTVPVLHKEEHHYHCDTLEF